MRKILLVRARKSRTSRIDSIKNIKTKNLDMDHEILRQKVDDLEQLLQRTRQERDEAISKNKSQIEELSNALLAIRSRIHVLMDEKKNRELRMKQLEEKIHNRS